MFRLVGDRSLFSAIQRFFYLVRTAGLFRTITILTSAIDDKYLKCFDRRYNIRTSGFIRLHHTSFDRARLADATQYGPVNGWGFRRCLRELNLPKKLHFVDFGCGLGRACILAAEYGFEKVTGVELAAELCVGARENVTLCTPPAGKLSPIEILQMDVLDYCERTDDDVFFMFRPFSGDFLNIVIQKIARQAKANNKQVILIYSERMALPGSFAPALANNPVLRKVRELMIWGQAFYIFECGGEDN
jgi:SAM-dependent methyltransferase